MRFLVRLENRYAINSLPTTARKFNGRQYSIHDPESSRDLHSDKPNVSLHVKSIEFGNMNEGPCHVLRSFSDFESKIPPGKPSLRRSGTFSSGFSQICSIGQKPASPKCLPSSQGPGVEKGNMKYTLVSCPPQLLRTVGDISQREGNSSTYQRMRGV
jgi:hypothetical protein